MRRSLPRAVRAQTARWSAAARDHADHDARRAGGPGEREELADRAGVGAERAGQAAGGPDRPGREHGRVAGRARDRARGEHRRAVELVELVATALAPGGTRRL